MLQTSNLIEYEYVILKSLVNLSAGISICSLESLHPRFTLLGFTLTAKTKKVNIFIDN